MESGSGFSSKFLTMRNDGMNDAMSFLVKKHYKNYFFAFITTQDEK